MLKLKVTNQNIQLLEVTPYGSPLVEGSAGEYECWFEFDESWDGLTKTAIFKLLGDDGNFYCSCDTDDEIEPKLLDEENKCTIPARALWKDTKLKIGVFGVKDGIQRPTVYTPALRIMEGALPLAEMGAPTSDIYVQIVEIMQETKQAVSDLRDDLNAGKFGVPTGGEIGQVIVKTGDADFQTEWQTNAPEWTNVKNKPFEKINNNELEILGEGQEKTLGVKLIPETKVEGLVDDLASKVSGVQVNGKLLDPTPEGVVDVKVPTKVSQIENDADYANRTELKDGLDKKLDLTGGKMSGDIDMDNKNINNVPEAVLDHQPVNFIQLKKAIEAIGTVFDLKGSKPTYNDLPKEGNEIGDIWYVEDEEVGYIWIEKQGVPQWEKLGAPIDLSGYLTKAGLLSTTGSAIDNTMSQDAITKELNKKANNTTVDAIPVVKAATGKIETNATTVTVNYIGKLYSYYVKTISGEEVMTDVDITNNTVVFSIAEKFNETLICTVVYSEK